ncbi:MAG: alkaline phosphatase [Balneolaceae bacterium]
MTSTRFIIQSLLIFSFIASVVSCNTSEQQTEIPKNIILLIGDGMGYPQVTATEYVHGSLNMTGMPYAGSVFTHANDHRVTDSASSATTYASGYKTNNGMIGMAPDGTPLESIAHYASEIGKRTALMATSRITHATPASFAVHHESRSDEFIIAEKFVNSGIDMILGAGTDYFLPEVEGGARPDERNLIAEMQELGYLFIDDENELDQMAGQEKVIVFLEGGDLQTYPDRGDQAARITMAALDELSRHQEGFFMMIEGSMIDWAAHDNNAGQMIQETIDFDNVIGSVLEFARNDGNTLVIVTADHETGGLTLPAGEENDVRYEFSTGGHTALQVPVYSYGPSSEMFTGTLDNTDIGRNLFSLWGKAIED